MYISACSPISLSRGCCGGPVLRLVESSISEHGEQDVGSLAGQVDRRLVVAFAFGALSVVAGPRVGISKCRECGQVKDAFEDRIPASRDVLAADRGPRAVGDRS